MVFSVENIVNKFVDEWYYAYGRLSVARKCILNVKLNKSLKVKLVNRFSGPFEKCSRFLRIYREIPLEIPHQTHGQYLTLILLHTAFCLTECSDEF